MKNSDKEQCMYKLTNGAGSIVNEVYFNNDICMVLDITTEDMEYMIYLEKPNGKHIYIPYTDLLGQNDELVVELNTMRDNTLEINSYDDLESGTGMHTDDTDTIDTPGVISMAVDIEIDYDTSRSVTVEDAISARPESYNTGRSKKALKEDEESVRFKIVTPSIINIINHLFYGSWVAIRWIH